MQKASETAQINNVDFTQTVWGTGDTDTTQLLVPFPD